MRGLRNRAHILILAVIAFYSRGQVREATIMQSMSNMEWTFETRGEGSPVGRPQRIQINTQQAICC